MRRGPLLVCAALLALGIAGPPARAAEPHRLQEEISIPAPPPGKNTPLQNACGIAVDQSGRIFASSYYDHAVYVFGPRGSEGREIEAKIALKEPPVAPNGKSVGGPCDLALDSAGNLYVNNWHYDVVKLPRLTQSPPSFGPGTVIDSNGSTGVAFDPGSGHVLVDDRAYLAEYETSGAPVLEGGDPVRIGLGSLGSGYGVAVSSFLGAPGLPATAGRVYVADAADGTVKSYDPSGNPAVPVQVIDGGGTPRLGFTRLVDSDLAVDPVDGHLYVVDNLEPFFAEPEAVVYEFSSLGHYRATVPGNAENGRPAEIVDGEPSAIAIFDHDVYLTSGNYFADNDEPEHRGSQLRVYGPTASVETRILEVRKTGAGSGTVFSSSPAGLGCGVSCEGEFELGRIVVLDAVAAAHSRFLGWTGCTPLASPSQCSLGLAGNRQVSAEFEPVPPRHLTVLRSGNGTVASAPAGIDCGATCDADFDEAAAVTLTASPASGGKLDHWNGCDSNPSPEQCRVMIDAPRQVEAVFAPSPQPPASPPIAPGQRILSVLATGSGAAAGTVTSAPAGIDCGPTCARHYPEGTAVTLVAHPAPGSRLLGWGGCDSSAGDRCAVALGADKTVVVTFGPGSPGSLKPRGVAVRGAAATLRLSVPAAGTLSAFAPGLRPASALPLAAGRASLALHLNGVGRRALVRAGRRGLAVRVALALAPFDGGDIVRARKTVVFGGRRGRR
jgi:hypothetical protein